MGDKPDIRSIFSSAIEIESADERGAYLDRACTDAERKQYRLDLLED